MTNDYERINFWKTEVEKLPNNTQQQKSTRKPRPNTAQGEKPGYKAPSRNSKKETEKKPVNEKVESA